MTDPRPPPAALSPQPNSACPRPSGLSLLALAALGVVLFIGRERLLATKAGEAAAMRERLFAFMARNAASPDVFYGLPPEHVIELGLRVNL